jgi:glycosyltransferase involved in cell wall biosynthesis
VERGKAPVSASAARIAIVVHASLPDDPRIRRQAEALRDAGHEVDLFGLRDPGQPEVETWNGIRIVRLPVRRRFAGFAGHLAEYLAFAALVSVRLAVEHRHRHYRLVQVATLPDFLTFATLPVHLTGVPVLLDLHEDMPEFFRDRFASAGLRPLFPLVSGAARASAKLADAVITVHEPLRELAVARGIPADRISVVMNSADERLFDLGAHPRRPWRDDGTLRLVHHSNLQRIYGLDVAVEAMARLDPGLDAHLDVYGDGPFRPEVEAAIARHDVTQRVTLHGRVPLETLPGVLAAADLAVVPTRPEPYLAYSLSTKLLEAVAMRLPVIASDLHTTRLHFDDAAIRFVPGGDPAALATAIAELADDPAAADRQAEAAARQAEPYAWAIQRRHYLAVVDGLLGRGRLGASHGA